MAPAVTEAALYAQLAHFARLLDADAALARVRDEAEREVTHRFPMCMRLHDGVLTCIKGNASPPECAL